MNRTKIVEEPITGVTLWVELHNDGLYGILDPAPKHMTPDDYRLLLVAFAEGKETIKELGFMKLYSMVPDDDMKIKFNAMFGFQIEQEFTDRKGNLFFKMGQDL